MTSLANDVPCKHDTQSVAQNVLQVCQSAHVSMAVTCLLQWAWLHDCASQSMQHIPAMKDPCKQKVVATILTLLHT